MGLVYAAQRSAAVTVASACLVGQAVQLVPPRGGDELKSSLVAFTQIAIHSGASPSHAVYIRTRRGRPR